MITLPLPRIRHALQAGLSLRTRFVLRITAVSLLLLLLLLPAATWLLTRIALENARQRGFRLVEIFAHASTQAVAADDFLIIRPLLNSTVGGPDILYAMILDPAGRILAHSDSRLRGRLLTDPESLRAARSPRREAWEIRHQGRPALDFAAPIRVLTRQRAVARIGISLERDQAQIRWVRNAILLVGLLALGVGALLAVYQSRQIIRRLEAAVAERTAALGEANARLQELDRLKSEFVSHVSHELRTPLAAIRMSVENLADGVAGETSPTVRRYLVRVRENTDRLTRLITDLLDLSRIEAGRVALVPAPLPIEGLVREVLEGLRPLADGQGVALVASPAAGAEAQADRDKVAQVLINLVENAIKFTPRGGSVTVSARPIGEAHSPTAHPPGPDAPSPAADGSLPLAPSVPPAQCRERRSPMLEVVVADTGEGIPPDQACLVFDKFHQVRRDGRPRAGGTGLGLTIAKSLVELHGGTIRLESQVGVGSRFCFTLPASTPPTPAPGGAP